MDKLQNKNQKQGKLFPAWLLNAELFRSCTIRQMRQIQHKNMRITTATELEKEEEKEEYRCRPYAANQ
jgi:hypothetical protein